MYANPRFSGCAPLAGQFGPDFHCGPVAPNHFRDCGGAVNYSAGAMPHGVASPMRSCVPLATSPVADGPRLSCAPPDLLYGPMPCGIDAPWIGYSPHDRPPAGWSPTTQMLTYGEDARFMSPASMGIAFGGTSMANAASGLLGAIHQRSDEAFSMISSTFDDLVENGKKHIDAAVEGSKIRIEEALEEGIRRLSQSPTGAACARPVPHHHHEDRRTRRLLVIGAGFGLELNPRQAELLVHAGFQVHWMQNIPNPEQPGFRMFDYLPLLKVAIGQFKPHLVACASKGGHFMVALWQTGLWRGPSLMINAHPGLKELPRGVPIVVAQGSNDQIFMRSRTDLETLISTGSTNMCFLYYTGDSGTNAAGQCARVGDKHDMASLLTYDCLPRLVDAAMCNEGPETHMIWSWTHQVSKQRLEAEQWLGYCPEQLQRLWVSSGHKGLDEEKLFQVFEDKQEFHMVADIFHAAPVAPSAYGTSSAAWDNVRILRIDRVENGWQEEGSAKPYYAALQKSIEDQGICFQPGIHTRWVFHGTDAIESIICNPLAGFQPLASGSRLGSVWGSGTYFARDPKYVFDGHFCQPAADGTYQILMCLAMTGVPCLGDPQHKGVLPFHEKPHRYNSSVDSLSSPEVFVVQHPSAVYPAYLITFS